MRNYSPESDEKLYYSAEVIIACQVTSRELQWWDEKRVIQPAMIGHHREYTELQAVEVALVKHMRARGVGLNTVRKILATWRRTGQVERARFIIVAVEGKIQTANDEAAVITILRSMRAGWLIDAAEKGRITRATLTQGLQRTDSGRRRADTDGRAGLHSERAGSFSMATR